MKKFESKSKQMTPMKMKSKLHTWSLERIVSLEQAEQLVEQNDATYVPYGTGDNRERYLLHVDKDNTYCLRDYNTDKPFYELLVGTREVE